MNVPTIATENASHSKSSQLGCPADEKPDADSDDEAAKKKKKMMMIVGGAIAAVLLCCCCPSGIGTLGYFMKWF